MQTETIRLLLVEDMAPRHKFFVENTPKPFKIVWARSGGAALNILAKDEPDTYAGLLLDFDLYEQGYVLADRKTDGGKVAEVIAQRVFNDIPVLVHSMNPRGATRIVDTLSHAGFPVTRIPFAEMTAEKYATWLGAIGAACGALPVPSPRGGAAVDALPRA